jgi:hypothetical protein
MREGKRRWRRKKKKSFLREGGEEGVEDKDIVSAAGFRKHFLRKFKDHFFVNVGI